MLSGISARATRDSEATLLLVPASRPRIVLVQSADGTGFLRA